MLAYSSDHTPSAPRQRLTQRVVPASPDLSPHPLLPPLHRVSLQTENGSATEGIQKGRCSYSDDCNKSDTHSVQWTLSLCAYIHKYMRIVHTHICTYICMYIK